MTMLDAWVIELVAWLPGLLTTVEAVLDAMPDTYA